MPLLSGTYYTLEIYEQSIAVPALGEMWETTLNDSLKVALSHHTRVCGPSGYSIGRLSPHHVKRAFFFLSETCISWGKYSITLGRNLLTVM